MRAVATATACCARRSRAPRRGLGLLQQQHQRVFLSSEAPSTAAKTAQSAPTASAAANAVSHGAGEASQGTLARLGQAWKQSAGKEQETISLRQLFAVPRFDHQEGHRALRWAISMSTLGLALPVGVFLAAGAASDRVRLWQMVHLPLLEPFWTSVFPSNASLLSEHLATHPADLVAFACRSVRFMDAPAPVKMVEYRRSLALLAETPGALDRSDVRRELRRFGLTPDVVAAMSGLDGARVDEEEAE